MESIPPLSFEGLALPENLQKSLAKMGFTAPTPIQAQTLPLALEGRDVIGCAQTGTGKTGAFVIPTVARMAAHPDQTALIMTPTRELALQIFEVVRNMTWFEKNWGSVLLIGGSAYGPQFQGLRRGPRFVIGTPGRIQDHLNQGSLSLEKTGVLVLDEADRMLDMGFAPQIEEILKGVPANRQTFLFTATLPREIEQIAQRFMTNPARLMVGENSKPIAKIKQEMISTPEDKKMGVLLEQLTAREGSVLIFTKTKRRTERLTHDLEIGGYQVASIHGDKSQAQRANAVRDFKKGQVRILVATDVAARGLDVPHIAHVINFDLPQVPEDFVHRIGRTARAGAEGNALSLVTPSERGMWNRIQRLITGDNKAGYSAGPRPSYRSDGGYGPKPVRDYGPRREEGQRFSGPAGRKPFRDDRVRGDSPNRPFPRREDRPAFSKDDRPARSGFRPLERSGFSQDRPAFAAHDRAERPAFRAQDRSESPIRPVERSERPSFRQSEREERSFRGSDKTEGSSPIRSVRSVVKPVARAIEPVVKAPVSHQELDVFGDPVEKRPARIVVKAENKPYNREERSSVGRGERSSFGQGDRPQRPSFRGGERSSFRDGERSERPSFNRGDRPARPAGFGFGAQRSAEAARAAGSPITRRTGPLNPTGTKRYIRPAPPAGAKRRAAPARKTQD